MLVIIYADQGLYSQLIFVVCICQMLEMSPQYTPELSNFKSAVVMCVTPTTNTVRLRYTEDTIQHEMKRGQ